MGEQTIAQTGATKWTRQWLISPNNRNFPSAQLPPGGVSNMDGGDDLEALMTGIYGSAVPCLCTYPNEVTNDFQVAQIATTLRDGKGKQRYFINYIQKIVASPFEYSYLPVMVDINQAAATTTHTTTSTPTTSSA